jgi:carbonic anhydrase
VPIRRLIDGFNSFKITHRGEIERLVENGQSPETCVIACSDSRNDPALITESKPGDLFSIRNVAALVPPYQSDKTPRGVSSAIEYAVKGLKVKRILVLGHARCGGAASLTDPPEATSEYEFLAPWMSVGKEVVEAVNRFMCNFAADEKKAAIEKGLIVTSLNNLLTFPFVKMAVENGSLTLFGWYFDMPNMRLLDYDFETAEFRDVDVLPEGYSRMLHQSNCCGPSVPKFVENATQLAAATPVVGRKIAPR